MRPLLLIKKIIVAASVIAGAASMVSCGRDKGGTAAGRENVMTMRSDTLTITQSNNGKLKMHGYTPVMEEYAYASDPYREFPRGIDAVTYDTLGNVESTIKANYALFWIELERWDLKGDVVATNVEGDKMETQQLTWNQKSEQIWSNVQTRLTRNNGTDRFTGTGFTSKQDLSEWRFRHGEGTQSFVAEPNRDIRQDSLPSDVPIMAGE